MTWLLAVLGDLHFWVGMAAGTAGVLALAWEHRRLLAFRQAREKDAYLRKCLGY